VQSLNTDPIGALAGWRFPGDFPIAAIGKTDPIHQPPSHIEPLASISRRVNMGFDLLSGFKLGGLIIAIFNK
jgi:hypothetical protein